MPNSTSRIVANATRRYAMARHRNAAPSTKKVYFLVVTIDGFGGVARSVAAHASALADRHDVEIVSVYRRRDKPVFAVDPRVRITYLDDQRRPNREIGRHGSTWIRARGASWRPLISRALDRQASRFTPFNDADLSALTDVALVRHLPKLEPGVLITARPALHAAGTALAPPHLLTIAHEHVHHGRRMRKPDMEVILRAASQKYDAIVTLTEADAADYRRSFPRASALMASVPNPTPWEPLSSVPALDHKVVVSAGRLNPQKGFDRLITAYAPIAAKHPDWQLHIYGMGSEGDMLRDLIRDLGVEHVVKMMGFTEDIPAALSTASIYALASRFEPFGMVLIEAMSRGMPVVSYDAPQGPRQIIDDGRTGRLIPNGDTEAMTAALLELIEDPSLRQRMGAAALIDVKRFSPEAIAQRWDEIFEQLLARRTGAKGPGGRTGGTSAWT